ncbi:laccase [Suillus bovinus]|uniref:laccase n=1 Tax=Suillus bovinus TaxID=48563 RepID=UPI001B874484|nr:laccase [Suillus bovinus]KAG2130446.1 laccase [Suillus bovinus]
MFILLLVVSLVSLIDATSVSSRSQSYPLSQPAVTGPKTRMVIGNRLIAPDGFPRNASLVDGTFPGPLVTAQKGDHFDIEVVNMLKGDGMFEFTSVHWHGIFQNKTNYADGTANVTQCPIMPNHSFLYSFSAQNQTGTYWYHSHYSVQYCDGVRGPLVIYDPQDPYADMYDVDDASTVITLADWYHGVSPGLRSQVTLAKSMLINGLGRSAQKPKADLAVINVEQGKRYRFRLVQISCDANVLFSIDGHNLTVIEADGQLTESLVVDQLQIFAGQRYSVVLVADQPVNNYWVRSIPNSNGTYDGSAILRYKYAPEVEPTTVNTSCMNPLKETDLHALINPGAPGKPVYGDADINLTLEVSFNASSFQWSVNNVPFKSPYDPILSQILNETGDASQLQTNGSVYLIEANKVVELTMKLGIAPGGPHPIHLHGHAFDVVQSADSSTFNYANPVRRDVVSAGSDGQHTVIRWITDNPGPWFIHCHIDWHLDEGFAVVMAESPQDTSRHINPVPEEWYNLCPIYHYYTEVEGGLDLY